MAGSGSDGLAELTAEELADLPDFTPNIYKVVRALRKDDHGPYNCLASIVHDAAFVKGVVREYRLPTFANLRCGLWYAGRHHAGNESWAGPRLPGEEDEPPESEDGGLGEDAERTRGEEEDDVRAAIDGTCYFKSTDGHCNNWSFSGTRLNVHVAEAAARRGGCVIVDATRSTTKRFPDSFSKTVPIWAETLNRAVRDARRRARADGPDAFQNETNAAGKLRVGRVLLRRRRRVPAVGRRAGTRTDTGTLSFVFRATRSRVSRPLKARQNPQGAAAVRLGVARNRSARLAAADGTLATKTKKNQP
jgi:hypothetical protein